ncbi:NAD(P)/FAD-dependent oxidoreductase [Cellulomonas xiejunii]|uniref:Ferredoxin--NADP reductase n=1 Tax=Cellulomonas xiejunii TaxID=2968083 RepID=A0ABY5KN09_9CELL|nr:NAD(P)/FAD-dependent oxidoreductase [Cellulomonas xiejunii]MCC2312915.1 NAD(P)/FAD-dependent oxidoreductase [Cellulomonas xiejunii]MCC2320215.1 NAD(P)/FAD-dependent oxidoreductase [Cellulomonas xiejunii]UUI70522.1 NAD(P)/FAD-dependent oxidoreductase [Cellulomonas xiejunii]
MKSEDVLTHHRGSDIVIVGAGPAGLFAAYYAGFRGLSVTVVDANREPGGQVSALYPAKIIHDVAGYVGVSGADLVTGLVEQAAAYSPTFIQDASVVDLTRDERTGILSVSLADGRTLDARAVVLATGAGSVRPRALPAGHGWAGRGVTYVVTDPQAHADEDVVIVGGGDTALDWAIQLSPIARSVTVVHRRRQFRAHGSQIARAESLGVALLTESEVQAINGDDVVRSVLVRDGEGAERVLPADTVIGALGLVTGPSPFASWGIDLEERKILVDAGMQTNLPGVYAAGDCTTFRGKVTLMVTGFGEAATAINNAAVYVDPDLSLIPGHSTDE